MNDIVLKLLHIIGVDIYTFLSKKDNPQLCFAVLINLIIIL